MVKSTRLRHKESNEIMTFIRIEPIKFGMAIDHYIFRKNGKEIAMPMGEWSRVKFEWEIIN
jgi:hypothetical protein